MGAGKSSVGKELAKLLFWSFFDLDTYIESKTGRKIPEIFASEGEAAFRKMECDALDEILGNRGKLPEDGCAGKHLVLSLGGGTLTTGENAEKVAGETICIYLKASADTLACRLQGEAERRPMLAGGELRTRIGKLLKEREPIYEKTAHHTIVTDGMSINEIAAEIVEILKQQPDFQSNTFERNA